MNTVKIYRATTSFFSLIGFLFLLLSCNPSKINYEALDLANKRGKKVEISDYKGDIVFLNFWASWCAPCVHEMPQIAKAAEALHKKDIEFVMITDEPEADMIEFIEKHGLADNMDFLHSRNKMKEAGIVSLPQTFILDRGGQIIDSHGSNRDWSSPESIELLKSYLDKK